VQGHLVRRPGRCWRRCLSVGLPGGGWARTRAAARRCTASRGGGGDGDGDGEVAADGGAERARGAGNLHTIIHTTRTNDVHRAAGAASVFWRSWPYTRTAAPLQYSVPGVRITKYFQKSPSHSTVFQFDPLTFSALRGGGRRRPCRRAYRYGLWGRGRASSSAARLPVIGRPNADILHHGPPAARVRTYAHGPERLLRRGSGRRAAAGAPRHRARGTRGGRPVSGERRAAGTG